VGHHPDPVGVRACSGRGGEDAPLPQPAAELGGGEGRDLEHHDVRFRGPHGHPLDPGQALGQEVGVLVIFGQPVDVVFQGVQASGRQDADLSHPAPQRLPHPARSLDELAGAAHQRSHRTAQALGEAEMSIPLPERITQEAIYDARRQVLLLHLSPEVEKYIVELVESTRDPSPYSSELSQWIRWGASPRGAIAIERGARVLAWLDGRDYVTPEDVQHIAPDALRHRIILQYEAEADGISPAMFVSGVLRAVPAP